MMQQEERIAPKPEWLRIKLDVNRNYRDVKNLVHGSRLHTVCEEARCPNMHECWSHHRTATFMILGDTCTRRCRFCAVKTGLPGEVDILEPRRVAVSAAKMKLEHVVVTMVNRDDLPDGGASVMANTVRAIRAALPAGSIEILSSDLMGREEDIRVLSESRPDIMSHNIETVRRLTPRIRSRSEYERSLSFLRIAKRIDPSSVVKSSIMLGLGEEKEEISEAMDDLLAAGVTILNIGQYLQPSRTNIPVVRYWRPEEFEELRLIALAKGFLHCESGPLVRSSYHAGEQFENFRKNVLGR